MMIMKQAILMMIAAAFLVACNEEDADAEDVAPRGLKTVLVAENENSVLRRFPSVLEPAELTTVGFEAGGRLGAIDLRVGQVVAEGDVLAQLDASAFEIQIASAESAVEQARAAAQNSAANLARQEELLARGVVTSVAVDNARTQSVGDAQALVQAERALDSARSTLGDTDLLAPFDGVISSVDTQSFSTVGAGSPIATLYRADEYEVSFTVNYETISRLAVGKLAVLRLADTPDRTLRGVVTELGASADTVSSFPVVISVKDAPMGIKAGMAVEVNLEFELPAATGFTIPLSAVVVEGATPVTRNLLEPVAMQMFVYDAATATVKKREVFIAGVRENSVLVVSGLEAGERVASAGVSFLADGQAVTLLED
jgi:RND family efflux transporter MFP subunit